MNSYSADDFKNVFTANEYYRQMKEMDADRECGMNILSAKNNRENQTKCGDLSSSYTKGLQALGFEVKQNPFCFNGDCWNEYTSVNWKQYQDSQKS